MHFGAAESRRRRPRTPWYQNSNWLLLAVAIVVGLWLIHVFTQRDPTARPTHPDAPSRQTVVRVYRKPAAPARIVQHGHIAGDRGSASPTDLSGSLDVDPKVGDVLLAFGSTGFGCVAAPGWTAIGGDGSRNVAVAYRIARPGDGKAQVPFVTTRASSYTLELIEIAGGPDILASAQVGGAYVRALTIPTTISLAIPQTGGILFGLYAASGMASKNGEPVGYGSTLPPGQTQSLVDRIPAYGWGADLVVRATTTDPRSTAQPFNGTETVTFARQNPPGNTVAGWFVWVGGAIAPDHK